jgi:hypothetical protein
MGMPSMNHAFASRRGDQNATYYEYRTVTLPGSVDRGDVRRLLTDEAEYGRWELARTSIYTGGDRKVWLRRRIIRVESTLGVYAD